MGTKNSPLFSEIEIIHTVILLTAGGRSVDGNDGGWVLVNDIVSASIAKIGSGFDFLRDELQQKTCREKQWFCLDDICRVFISITSTNRLGSYGLMAGSRLFYHVFLKCQKWLRFECGVGYGRICIYYLFVVQTVADGRIDSIDKYTIQRRLIVDIVHFPWLFIQVPTVLYGCHVFHSRISRKCEAHFWQYSNPLRISSAVNLLLLSWSKVPFYVFPNRRCWSVPLLAQYAVLLTLNSLRSSWGRSGRKMRRTTLALLLVCCWCRKPVQK